MITPIKNSSDSIIKGMVPAAVAAVFAALIATAAFPFIIILAIYQSLVFKTRLTIEVLASCWWQPYVLIWNQLNGFFMNPLRFFSKERIG
jgi:hypothetical protein